MNSQNEQEIEFRKEFDDVIRQSSSMESFKPTYEDIVRFHSQATRLLLKIEYYASPMELQITGVADGGRYFSYLVQNPSGVGVNTQWVETKDVEVLMMFPPAELKKRIQDLNDPLMKTMKEVKQILANPEFQIRKAAKGYRVFENGEDWKITFPTLLTARRAVESERRKKMKQTWGDEHL